MIKAVALGVCLVASVAHADDKADKPDKKPTEQAGSDESLQNGGDNRPWAAGVTETEQKAALQLFHEGNVQLNSGLFAQASDKYKEALKHWDHPAIHYNLALAQMQLDQVIEADDNMQVAIKYGEAPLQSKDKFDHAKDYLLLLDKQIATVEVSCDKPGAKVSVDGKEVFVAPGHFATKVRIGKHAFVAEKQGYTTRINAPFIGPGEKFRIELKLYTAEELTRYHRRWEDATWMPYAVIGGGVLVGALGGLFELSARSSFSDYDTKVAACSMNNTGCPSSPELVDLRNSGNSKQTLAYIGYGVGLGAIAVGAALAIVNRPQPYQIRAEDLQGEGEGPHVTITPIVTPGMAGAMVQGHF